jgi:hypothetical protein
MLAAVQGIKRFKSLPINTANTQKIRLAPLAFSSQRGDSGGLLANARLTPRICSSTIGVPRAATRNLSGICPKSNFLTRDSGRVYSTGGGGGGGREPRRFRAPATRCTSGPRSSIPYSRTGRITEWMMRSLAATLMHRPPSGMLPTLCGRRQQYAYPKSKRSSNARPNT